MMKLTHFTVISLASMCVAYTTVSEVLSDIINLDNAVKRLTASTAAYAGGILAIQDIDFDFVESRLKQGNTDAAQLPPGWLGTSDTQSIVALLSNTLAIDNPHAVKTFQSKKQLIDATPGQTFIVREGLQSLLEGHLYFSYQIIQRTPPAQFTQIQYYVDVISNTLRDGVNAFSS